jgi:hypothetical protein
MTRMELLTTGRVKIDPTKRGNDILPRKTDTPSLKSLTNLDRPPYWLQDVCVVGLSEKKRQAELTRQAKRIQQCSWYDPALYVVEYETIPDEASPSC